MIRMENKIVKMIEYSIEEVVCDFNGNLFDFGVGCGQGCFGFICD